MTTTKTKTEGDREYTSYPGQRGLTCGDVIAFLQQFKPEQEIGWYLIAEDATEFVGLFASSNPDWEDYEGCDPAWPMIVTSFVDHDEVP